MFVTTSAPPASADAALPSGAQTTATSNNHTIALTLSSTDAVPESASRSLWRSEYAVQYSDLR
ncbi:MAG: hypothetical protein AMJ69_09510 [Gammaproteobacteria bacterium SG8_47]|nr:MAG: hypothetical protein AMJ69_09510 [Gammaproteobacteria bacterium SG8_47]